MKRTIVVAAMVSFVLSSAPLLLHRAIASPAFGRKALGAVAWKCFLVVTYPPVYLSDQLGWYDAFQSEVSKGVSVFQPPSPLRMFWTHSVVAIPFWFILVLALLIGFRWLAGGLNSQRARKG